jgi:hypothetical protein
MLPIKTWAMEEETIIVPESEIIESEVTEYAQELDEPVEINLLPKIYREGLEDAPPFEIPLHIIKPFLSRPRIVELDDFEAKPRVIGFAREHVAGSLGDEFYVNNINVDDENNKNFEVLRLGQAYIDLDNGNVLGYEAIRVADAIMIRPGAIAKLLLVEITQEVQMDDRVVPAVDDDLIENFIPTPALSTIEGRIIRVLNGVNQIGVFNVVAINKGEEDGLKYGNMLQVTKQPMAPCKRPLALSSRSYNPISCGDNYDISVDVPALLDSNEENPDLPYEIVGNLMVFRIFEHISYAIILRAVSAINVGDGVRGG